MANLIVNNVEYTTNTQPEWYQEAMKLGKTLPSGKIRVIPNVIKDVKVKKLASSNDTVSQVDGRDCTWNASEKLTASTKLMSTKPFKVNYEQCLDELDSIWSEQVARGADFPDGMEAAIFNVLQANLGLDLEKIIWGGTGNAVDGIQDGIIDKALVDADVLKVDGVEISVTNVISEIQKVYNAIPEAVIATGEYDYARGAVSIFVPFQVIRFLRQALSTVDSASRVVYQPFTMDGDKIYYMGIEIVSAGVPANTMVAASMDNIVFITDLLADTTSLRGARGADLKNEDMYYIKGKYRAESDYIMGSEIVLYRLP